MAEQAWLPCRSTTTKEEDANSSCPGGQLGTEQVLRLDGEPRSALCLSLLLAKVSIAGRLEHLLWVLFIHLIKSHHGPCEGGFIIFILKMAEPEPREAANWSCSDFISALSYSKFVWFFLFLLAPSLLCWASYINSPPPYSSTTFLCWALDMLAPGPLCFLCKCSG